MFSDVAATTHVDGRDDRAPLVDLDARRSRVAVARVEEVRERLQTLVDQPLVASADDPAEIALLNPEFGSRAQLLLEERDHVVDRNVLPPSHTECLGDVLCENARVVPETVHGGRAGAGAALGQPSRALRRVAREVHA